jgi:hypothetical protein
MSEEQILWWAEFCINLSYILSSAAFLIREMLWLRIVAIVAAIVAAMYGILEQEWSIFYWEAGIFVINAVQVVILIRERRNAVFNEEEKELHESLFKHFSSVQFKGMLKQATWVDAQPGEMLTEQGKPVVRLVLVVSGLASVDVDGTIVAYCKRHDFIGEMSFVSGEPATATVKTMIPTRFLMWTQDDLHKLLEHDDAIRVAMQTVLTKNLVSKLMTKSTDLE